MSMKSDFSELRNNLHKRYNNGAAERISVPEDKISWSVAFPEYSPPSYTLPIILTGTVPWADPELNDPSFSPNWNDIDKGTLVDRRTYGKSYEVVPGFGPLNPAGRTGLKGRGRLGRWGPNHAVDPVVTRFKVVDGQVSKDTNGLPYLQFIGIQRKDTKEWALPGGMVDPGEHFTAAVIREFMEEVFSSDEMSELDRQNMKSSLQSYFSEGFDAYMGYVDDPRNTDNSWMETRAVNVHLSETSEFYNMPLKAGSDALNAKWIDFDTATPLYASHKHILKNVFDTLKAHS